jgi:hypothetical protein
MKVGDLVLMNNRSIFADTDDWGVGTVIANTYEQCVPRWPRSEARMGPTVEVHWTKVGTSMECVADLVLHEAR